MAASRRTPAHPTNHPRSRPNFSIRMTFQITVQPSGSQFGCEADETVHGRRDLQPPPHLLFIGAVAQHNAADVISSTTLCHFDDLPREPRALDLSLLLQAAGALATGGHVSLPVPAAG